MTDMASVETLQRVLDLTEEMLSAARAEEWSKVAALDSQRQPLLRSAFREPIPPSSAEAIAALARQVHALNEELVRLSEARRTMFSRALAKLARGRQAQSAYGQNKNP